MQEAIENGIVNMAVSMTRLSSETIIQGIRAALKCLENEAKGSKHARGKQSVKKLVGQGEGVSSISISDERVREFNRLAGKYGIDYAILKDQRKEPICYTVFFKSKDTEVLSKIVEEFGELTKQNRGRKEIKEHMKEIREMAEPALQKTAEKVRERTL